MSTMSYRVHGGIMKNIVPGIICTKCAGKITYQYWSPEHDGQAIRLECAECGTFVDICNWLGDVVKNESN